MEANNQPFISKFMVLTMPHLHAFKLKKNHSNYFPTWLSSTFHFQLNFCVPGFYILFLVLKTQNLGPLQTLTSKLWLPIWSKGGNRSNKLTEPWLCFILMLQLLLLASHTPDCQAIIHASRNQVTGISPFLPIFSCQPYFFLSRRCIGTMEEEE